MNVHDDTHQIKKWYEKKNQEWAKFQEVTQDNLNVVETAIETCREKCHRLEETINNVKELSKQAQRKSFVKICSLAFVEAIVKHTGEYNVEYNSEYQATLTKDHTVEFLEEKLSEQKGILSLYISEKEQLERRLGYNFSQDDDIPDLSGLPEKIVTETGIAFKQGNFFEILEEENIPYKKDNKRISRVKKCDLETQYEILNIDNSSQDVNCRAKAFLDFLEN